MSEQRLAQRSARDFYDHLSGFYDLISNASEGALRDQGIEQLGLQQNETVLEVGFGTGHALVEMARRAGAVYGVDISKGMLEIADRRLKKEGIDNVILRRAECPPLPYPDAVFDAVFFSFTLELFSPELIPVVLSEVKRVLKDSGRVGVVAMARPKPSEKVSVLEHTYQWMHRHFPHIVDCAPIDPESLLEAAGFELSVRRRESMWTMPIGLTVGKRVG